MRRRRFSKARSTPGRRLIFGWVAGKKAIQPGFVKAGTKDMQIHRVAKRSACAVNSRAVEVVEQKAQMGRDLSIRKHLPCNIQTDFLFSSLSSSRSASYCTCWCVERCPLTVRRFNRCAIESYRDAFAFLSSWVQVRMLHLQFLNWWAMNFHFNSFDLMSSISWMRRSFC